MLFLRAKHCRMDPWHRQQALMAIGREEKSPFVPVLKVGDHSVGERPGFLEPQRVAGRGVNLNSPNVKESVILEVSGELGSIEAKRT